LLLPCEPRRLAPGLFRALNGHSSLVGRTALIPVRLKISLPFQWPELQRRQNCAPCFHRYRVKRRPNMQEA